MGKKAAKIAREMKQVNTDLYSDGKFFAELKLIMDQIRVNIDLYNEKIELLMASLSDAAEFTRDDILAALKRVDKQVEIGQMRAEGILYIFDKLSEAHNEAVTVINETNISPFSMSNSELYEFWLTIRKDERLQPYKEQRLHDSSAFREEISDVYACMHIAAQFVKYFLIRVADE